jgi:2,3-bisphosphoglycerate-independent phosphoglycerate mutase
VGRAHGTAARGDGCLLRRKPKRHGPGRGYLIALGARIVREVGDLVRRASEAGKRLATLSVDAEISFRSAADRAAFSAELSEAIGKLVSKYHDDTTTGNRAHRLIIVAHPLPQKSEPKELLQ